MIDAPEQEAVPTCTATGCALPQAPGSQLCALDVRRLGDWLAQLRAEYDRLDAEPSMQGREVGTIGGTTLAAQRSVGSMQVMAMRDRRRGTGRIAYDDADDWGLDDTPSVLSTLAGYAATVRDERKLVRDTRRLPPVRVTGGAEGPVCDVWCAHPTCKAGTMRAVAPVPVTVATERKLLATHLDWIRRQDWAGEFHDAIHSLWEALRGANGQGGGAQRARCLETVSGVPCPGVVSWFGGAATCSRCGSTTTGLAVVRRHSTASMVDGRMSA